MPGVKITQNDAEGHRASAGGRPSSEAKREYAARGRRSEARSLFWCASVLAANVGPQTDRYHRYVPTLAGGY
jgi:formylglycine-generating enzyme required for sulfatase activity